MKVILSHAGKQHSYHVANALDKLGFLERYYTSGYVTWPWLQKWAAKNPHNPLNKRFHYQLNTSKVASNWSFELKEKVLLKIYGSGDKVQHAIYHRDAHFDRYIAGQLKKGKFDLYWGFQGSCLESLKMANNLFKKSVCELSTAHVTEAKLILGEEKKLHPEWADSFDNLQFPESYQDRLEQEPIEAQKVLAASGFTKNSLVKSGIDPAKIHILPLGFDGSCIPFDPDKIIPYKNRPLRLLYAGRITQRKGIKYLLEAMKNIGLSNGVALDIIGFIHGSGHAIKPYKKYFRHLSPVAQAELFKNYQQYDALVLPSVFEGFGLVIIEAMAAGLPVITTGHTIGPDLIENDINGYIVPIRDAKALEDAIARLANKNPDELKSMKIKAREKAMNFTWDEYTRRLKDLIENAFDM